MRSAPAPAATVLMVGLVTALVVAWPLAHVIALRNALLVILLAWLVADLVRYPQLRRLAEGSKPAVFCLLAFFAWMFLVAALVDTDPARSFRGIKSEWLPAAVAFAVGAMLLPDLRVRGVDPGRFLLVIVWAMVGLSLLQVCVGLWFLLWTGALPEGYFGPFSAHKSYMTYVTAFAASFLIAALASPDMRRLLGAGMPALWTALAIVTAATYFSAARNGIVTLLIMGLVGSLVWLRQAWHGSGRRFWLSILGGGLLLCLAAGVAVQSDPRWSRLDETAAIAWDIDANRAWVNAEAMPLPLAADGQQVERTAYERISWAVAASRFLQEYPLGIGITREAFRELVARHYGPPWAAHSHVGYLDLGLEVGFPGLALWLLFNLVLMGRGARAGFGAHAGTGIALLLLVVGHCARTLVDSTLRDHILEQYLFFCALLLAAVAVEERQRSRARSGASDAG